MARLVLKLLGQIQISLDNQPLTGFDSDKSRALLIYLATEPPRLHRRETLAGLLWPDVMEASARQSLSQALSNMRKVLKEKDAEHPFFIATREGVQLSPDASITSDVAALREALTRNNTATTDIAALYGGPFLEGFTLLNAEGFEEWVLLQREALQREAIEVLDKHIAQNMASGNLAEVIAAARRQLELDPWREESHRDLMRAFALNGQRGDAIAQYEKCRKALAEALRIEPSMTTKLLLEEIRAGKIGPTDDGATAAAPLTRSQPAPTPAQPQARPPARPPARPTIAGLPNALTPFIGRAREVADLTQLLTHPEVRLVTVLGMGGMGKTRLSIQAALHVQSHFADGVAFVPLAAVNTPEQVVLAIINALGASANQQHDWAALLDNLSNTLGEKQMLLILDNLEHLLAASSDVDLIIQIMTRLLTTPHVKILTTSREALKLQSEWVFSLDGFDESHMADAIALFVQSAGHAQAQFQMQPDDESKIRRICQLVDGMPLGIELAASWTNLLELDDIRSEIEQSIEMLTTRMRDVPQRHRSITAVMDHSWQLMTADEQAVMARLSVFRGSFTREMAKQVAEASLTTLAQLVSKSLLRRSDQNRYDLHELMRQYAHSQLEQSGQRHAIQHRHAAAFLSYIEANDRKLHGPEAAVLKKRLELDLGNFRAAYQWATQAAHDGLSRADAALLALRLAATLARLYYMLPNWSEGNQMILTALPLVPSLVNIDALTRGRVELGLAVFQHTWGHYRAAVDHLELALAEFRNQPDQWFVAWTMSLMGQCLYALDEVARTEALVNESTEIFQRLGDRWGTGFTMWQRAHLARAAGDDTRAIQLAQMSLNEFRALNDRDCMALANNLLGEIAIRSKDFEMAAKYYQNALDLIRSTNNTAGVAWTVLLAGQALLGAGQIDQALPCFVESALLRETMGDLETLCEALQGMAICLAEQQHFGLAAQLFGSASRGRRGDSLILLDPLLDAFDHARSFAKQHMRVGQWNAEHTIGKLTVPHTLIEAAAAIAHVPMESA